MGASLGKHLPATRDALFATRNDLRETRVGLRDDLRIHHHEVITLLHQIDRNVRFICDNTLCPTGEMRTKHFTVTIDDGVGQGLLMRWGGKYFILTAAHVAVDLVVSDRESVEVKWTDATEGTQATVNNIFLPKEYVENGSIDVGLIEIEYDPNQIEWHALKIDKDPCADGVVVGEGHNQFHIRGERVHSISQPQSRHVVHAPSKPGMSGLPLFESSGKLFGILHGDTKHRGGHKATENDHPSAFLYADRIPNHLKLHCVKKDYFKVLGVAEGMEPEIADEMKLTINSGGVSEAYADFAKKLGEKLHMSPKVINKTSVDSMMATLANNCFTDQAVDIIDPIVVATNTSNEETVDELSMGHASALKKPNITSPLKRQRNQQAGQASSAS